MASPGIGYRKAGMTAERWQRIKAIFDGAVECDQPARAAYLREHCGNDQDLRREVQSLLASDLEGSSLLENPAAIEAAMAAVSTSEALLVLNDRYRVERELGRGGMSIVYLAQDRQLLSKRVVVKVLLDETSRDPWMRQKFQQEMEALARIDHPGVVGVLDTGLTAEGNQFLVMQYIEGTTLRGAIEPGCMNPARAAGIVRQIGQALAAAHEKGVWHRDLKPENIMLQSLGGEDHVKLIDFGIAGIQNSQFTGENTKIAGSLTYMAPEQLTGHSCAASDTYALGVVAYEMLTGTPPGTQKKSRPAMILVAERSILKAMSYRPELRHADVREFSEELYQTLTGGDAPRRTALPGAIEIAHVLFTDLVGYSLLPMDRQREYLEHLQQAVRESPRFQAAESGGELINLPTGDGMALAFFGDPTAPAQCAIEVAKALKSKPHLKLRMGIHSGPVYRVADMNANANVAGGGINMAQRVMDCGDAGHILVSKSVADVLLQLSQWSSGLLDLGECTVKHGVGVHLYNLANGEAGNPEPPRKFAAAEPKKKSKLPFAAALMATAAMLVAGALWMRKDGKSSGSTQDQSSIAVLPFANLSSEKNQEYFSDGLAEDLLDALAKIPGLRVAARTSSFQFRDKTEDVRVIGKKLNVATILEGSVRRQGNRTKITTQLIKTADGFQLWSNTYEREMTDVFAVQAEISRAVTGELKVALLGNKPAAALAPSANPEAYNAYLQGRYFLARRNKENLEKAATYFEQAIGHDANYAPAWVGLAEALSSQATASYIPAEEGYGKARESVERALALDENLGEAHAALGAIKMYHDWDWAGADASYRRALVLEPGNVRAIRSAGVLAEIMGRWDQAIALFRQVIEIDPLNSGVYSNLGVASYYTKRFNEAAIAFEKALELDPEKMVVHSLLSQVYLGQSNPAAALVEVAKENDPAARLYGLALAYHALGRKKESDASLSSLIAKFKTDAPFEIAEVYAFRGETDKAFEWLEIAYAEHDAGLSEIKGDPLLKSVVRDPRYPALLKKLRLPL